MATRRKRVMSEIDPVKFGQLLQAVATVSKGMEDMKKDFKGELDEIKREMAKLVAIKNKGKGFFTATMLFSAFAGAGLWETLQRILK